MNTNVPGTGVGIGIGAADPLLPQAVAWIERLRDEGGGILLYPISRLQREFKIGYSRTCALMEALAREKRWVIAFAEDGTRYARLRLEENA